MKRAICLFLLMMTCAASACAMDYDTISPNLIYTHLSDEAPSMPVLVDTIEQGITADEANAQYAAAQNAASPEATAAPVTWPQTFTVTVGGDTTLGSTDDLRKRDDCFENVVAEKGYGWFFSGLSELFSSDDLTLVNFEGTLTENDLKTDKKFNFKGPAAYTDILTLGSVEAVNIANNHIIDYGDQGKADTIENLKAAGYSPVLE